MSDNHKTVTLSIDDEEITVPVGTTILEAARMQGKDIPVICYHEATTANGLCRICVVDINGGRLLQPACVAECQNDTKVETRNARVERSRRTILEMLDAAVDLDEAPEIQDMMTDYGANSERFPDARPRDHAVKEDNPFYIRDYSQCVLCWRCVQVCAEDAQYTFALNFGERGYNTHISTAFEVPMTESPCVFCGQCIGVCPTGALKPLIEFGLEQGKSMDEIRQSSSQFRRKRQTEEE